MSAKRIVTQNELRSLMKQQKKRHVGEIKKIESPIAKYNQNGELTCIVCDSIVRSEAVWIIHLNSKNHRENIAKRSKRKEPPTIDLEEPPFKKPANLPPPTSSVRLKSILKNSDEIPIINVPPDFFESSRAVKVVENKAESEIPEALEEDISNGDQLPEGFFDDPKLDAKVRNVEYKDPIEEEWEQFQKAIKEETSKAQQIISEDQEEATTERQIDEIDEQLNHWSRVVSLEKKKREAVAIVSEVKMEGDDDFAPDEEFDEFVDWRSKASFR